MKKYLITFSYSIYVNAKDADEACEKAAIYWDENTPRTDEMSYEVVRVKRSES